MTHEFSDFSSYDRPLSKAALAEAGTRVRSVYVRRTYDGDVRHLIDDLLAGTATGREGRCILLVGKSGAGKSALAVRALRDNPALKATHEADLPALSVVLPAPCTLKQLAGAIARGLGYPLAGDPRENVAWERVRYLLADANVRLLHLDEIQHITSTVNTVEAVKVLNVLKGLMIDREHPISLVLSGLPEVVDFVERDTQVRRRCNFVFIGKVAPESNGMVEAVVVAMARKVGLTVPDDFLAKVVPRLMHAAEGQFGTAVDIAASALERALAPRDVRGDRLPPEPLLNVSHFSQVYQLRTGSPSFADPFTASDWKSINTSRVLGRGAPSADRNGKTGQ